MPKISATRRLLLALPFQKVRLINSFLELPPRKGQKQMVGQIVQQVGTSIDALVTRNGPFSLVEWNEIAVELRGAARNSFEAVCNEIEASLDPVFYELDRDSSISDIRGDNASVRILSHKLGIDRAELEDSLRETNGNTGLSTFVLNFREIQNGELDVVANASEGMRVASTRTTAVNLEKLSESWMRGQFVGADHVSIAAGFYDCEFLLGLFRRNRTVKSVRLLFNGLGGQRLASQREELQRLERQLRNDDRSVEVRLSFAPGLFHTKLFLITKNDATLAIVGSANATSAAFDESRNEEILVTLNDSKTLSDYFEAAWNGKRTKQLGDLETAAKSLVAFFRTGILYFKPVVTLSLSINPFREVLNSLTNEDRARLRGTRLPYADQDAGIGAFNLRLAVTGSTEVLESVDDVNDDAENGAHQARIKPWSVETCFGYWIPSALDSSWSAILDEVSAKKRARWVEFREMLLKAPEGELDRKFQEYVSAVGEILGTLPNPPEYSVDEAIFSRFQDRILENLEDPRRLERLVSPFTSGSIPEIWDDAPAYEDFRTTFFDYLSHVSGKNNRPRVPRTILRALGIDSWTDGEELLSLFEEHLRTTGWANEDWE